MTVQAERIVAVLTAHSPLVVSFDRILEAMGTIEGGTHQQRVTRVKVQMMKARKLISVSDRIVNVRGEGYRLIHDRGDPRQETQAQEPAQADR